MSLKAAFTWTLVPLRAASIFVISAFAANAEGPYEEGRTIANSSSAVDPETHPCRYFTPNADQVDFTIDMQLEGKKVPLSVPKIFLEDTWDHEDAASHKSQLFRVTIDTFSPLTREQASEQNRRGSRNRMTFLAGDKVDGKAIAEIQLLFADPGTHNRAFEGYELERSTHDLVQAVPQGSNPQRSVYFLLDANGIPKTIISCGMDGLVKFPRCRHHFRASGMDILASYPKTALADWHKIESNIAQFFVCAVNSYNKEDI